MRSIGKRFGSWIPFVFLAAAVSAPGSAMAAEPVRSLPFERIVEDVPGLLVLELNPAGFALDTASGQGIKVSCPGCHQSGRPGAPDLPAYRFDILTGPDAPVATLRILDSETRTVGIGVAPYPHTPTPRTMEYHPDAELYREAGAASARLLAARRLRGAPIRGVEIPLALWSENGKTLTLLKRVQIRLEFGRTLGAPAATRLEGAFRSAVKNPVGGAYLYASPRSKPLRKAGAAKADIGKAFVKIRVGDRNVEGFDEDRVYALAFSDAIRIPGAGALNGAKTRDLRLYTGINDTIPQKMDSAVPTGTLRQIPIEIVDVNGPGTFDEGDTLKFFGHGTSIWKRLRTDSTRIRFEFSADPYSYENYYYLAFMESGEAALRMQQAPALAPEGQPLPSTHAYLRAEKDLAAAFCDPSGVKDDESGPAWHWHWKGHCKGDTTVTLSRVSLASEKTRTLPDITLGESGDSVFVGFYVYGSRSDDIFTAYHGGGGNALARYHDSVSPGTWFVLPGPPEGAPAFQLDSLEWRGWQKRFDGYTVSYRRDHVFAGEPLWIFPSETGKTVSYGVKVQGGAGVKCLRVENGVATRSISVDAQGVFTDSLGLYSDARYYLYAGSSPLSPAALEMESSPPQGTAIQDLATGDNEAPEYLIVTSRSLLAQAVALKRYRSEDARALKVKTSVVLVEDIFRHYSSGRMSPAAIRDFLRRAYSEWGGKAPGANPLKYVLFFGDGHYDYRNIVASGLKIQSPNLIPPHEHMLDGGYDEIASDDFYGVVDPGESGFLGGVLDLAIGRLPLQTPEEAENYLLKIKAYEDPSQAGDWRARVVMAADDGNQRDKPNGIDLITDGHTTYSDRLGKKISLQQKGTTVDKVYLLDYPMNSAFHKPEAAKDLLTFINRGAVTVNYVGHGADDQWADEVLMQTNDALSRMQNAGKTPMVNAFSCTVGRFESLKKEGMSEQFVKTKSVGAIGAVSATRESYPGPNLELAEAFYLRVFPPDSSGLVVTAGEALRDAKNASQTGFNNLNDAKYQLLGEPVLLVRKPQLNVSLTDALDTVKALDCDTIRGRVEGGSGNGFVNIKIVAGSVHKSYPLPFGLHTQEVDKRGNILFERTFAYKDNAFATEYFIPKQISFGDSTAEILLFAWDSQREMEGSAAKQNLRILGTGRCASVQDEAGPRIRITGCEKKETGDLDFPDRVKLSLPNCLQIYVEDSRGGVLSAEGPDEGTTLEIAGVMDPFHPLPGIDELNLKSYQLTLDKQTIRPGTHLLKVSARDGYGNISMRRMQMDLTLDSSLNMVTAYNVPNPMKRNGTVFRFSTVMPSPIVEFGSGVESDRMEYEIRIFNQRGDLVHVLERAVSGETSWDGRDRWGNLAANGVYFYKVTARQILGVADPAKPSYRTLSSKRNILVISR